MRLFVGIELPKEIKDELFKVQKSVPSNLAKINWVSKKNLHLTLKFLGETDVPLERIKEGLRSARFDSFKVNLSEINSFSTKYKGYMKVLWAGIFPEKEVVSLQQGVDSALLSIFNGDQKFSPHITLGRVKILKKKKEFSELLKKTTIRKLEFEIKNFKLFESKLTKDGSKYSILETFKS